MLVSVCCVTCMPTCATLAGGFACVSKTFSVTSTLPRNGCWTESHFCWRLCVPFVRLGSTGKDSTKWVLLPAGDGAHPFLDGSATAECGDDGQAGTQQFVDATKHHLLG